MSARACLFALEWRLVAKTFAMSASHGIHLAQGWLRGGALKSKGAQDNRRVLSRDSKCRRHRKSWPAPLDSQSVVREQAREFIRWAIIFADSAACKDNPRGFMAAAAATCRQHLPSNSQLYSLEATQFAHSNEQEQQQEGAELMLILRLM